MTLVMTISAVLCFSVLLYNIFNYRGDQWINNKFFKSP